VKEISSCDKNNWAISVLEGNSSFYHPVKVEVSVLLGNLNYTHSTDLLGMPITPQKRLNYSLLKCI
jgi:hypothetical protein